MRAEHVTSTSLSSIFPVQADHSSGQTVFNHVLGQCVICPDQDVARCHCSQYFFGPSEESPSCATEEKQCNGFSRFIVL